MNYPTKIEVNGKIYNLDTDYRTAIACFKAINDNTLSNFKRGYIILTLLIGDFELEDMKIALDKCAFFLRCGKEKNDSRDIIDFDHVKDEVRVRTSIRQCYKINLNTVDYMHWWEYNELIEGLTPESLINKVREIRSYDLSEETDEKRKLKILEAKQAVALDNEDIEDLSEEEKNNISEFDREMGL